ncbi:hypothetical protein [Halobacillus campisalis]|uniref:Uncharacterized protein n=1 Tax=Halobacillus campisalis TaxID=435909 RepID=A0ABW2K0A2_9BACI|nr:hypothetical protein [Halobacillus campisalis]
MKGYITKATYLGTFLSFLSFIALMLDPFRGWIFNFLSRANVNYYVTYANPFTYLLVAYILFFVLSILSISQKAQLNLKYLCVSLNGIGIVVAGFIVFIGNAL